MELYDQWIVIRRPNKDAPWELDIDKRGASLSGDGLYLTRMAAESRADKLVTMGFESEVAHIL